MMRPSIGPENGKGSPGAEEQEEQEEERRGRNMNMSVDRRAQRRSARVEMFTGPEKNRPEDVRPNKFDGRKNYETRYR